MEHHAASLVSLVSHAWLCPVSLVRALPFIFRITMRQVALQTMKNEWKAMAPGALQI